MSDNRSATSTPITEDVPKRSKSNKTDNKSESKFSVLKKNIKKNLKMSSKQKDEDRLEVNTGAKKKKSKKVKDKSQLKPSTSTEQEGSEDEKTLTGSVVRKLSLDKLYPKIKISKVKDDITKERRATTPDISSITVALKEELKRAEKGEIFVPETKASDLTYDSEISEEYRTPACQSPEGSYVEENSQSFQSPTESVFSKDTASTSTSLDVFSVSTIETDVTEHFSDAFQEHSTQDEKSTDSVPKEEPQVIESSSSTDNIDVNIETKPKIAPPMTPPDLEMDPILLPDDTSSPSTPNLTDMDEGFHRNENLPPLTASQEAPQAIGEKHGDTAATDKLEYGTQNQPVPDSSAMKKRDIFSPPELENQASGDKRECLFKILVIGELGTGKTSIIKRYVHEFFSQHYRATIGVDFALKVINWDQDTVIRLQLWDIAGQERFGNMTRVYYKEAVGAFIVFDVTRLATFDAVLKWKQDLDSKVQLPNGNPIPCVLLANKCDQAKEGPVNNPEKIDQFCKENNFSDWFETSAKENINIDQAAKGLVTKILQNDKLSQNGKESSKDSSKFPLDGKNGDPDKKLCAC